MKGTSNYGVELMGSRLCDVMQKGSVVSKERTR
jgi:hypothetical protein